MSSSSSSSYRKRPRYTTAKYYLAPAGGRGNFARINHTPYYSASKNIRKAQKMMGVERKYYDTALAATNLNTGATAWSSNELDPTSVLCLSAPAQGDGATNRDGNKIVVTSVEITGHVDFTGGANIGPASNADVFLALVQDTMCNGTELNSEDVFTSLVAESATTPLRNMSFGKRFKVLKTWNLNSMDWIVQAGHNFWLKSFKHYAKLTMPVTFTTGSTAAGVASVASSNALFLVGCCLDNTATDKWHITYNARIRFVG